MGSVKQSVTWQDQWFQPCVIVDIFSIIDIHGSNEMFGSLLSIGEHLNVFNQALHGVSGATSQREPMASQHDDCFIERHPHFTKGSWKRTHKSIRLSN